eukprot:TRINITY_DN11354_c1_g1_i1.p1 TRINITY_DN11354_c1_g1~~TRINITY_DN11354_c1_g1_i1.p1  ORF type:complete len:543 (+),score=246.92 TRINITY_DN11354_c1_g1_i1:42-1670(+)
MERLPAIMRSGLIHQARRAPQVRALQTLALRGSGISGAVSQHRREWGLVQVRQFRESPALASSGGTDKADEGAVGAQGNHATKKKKEKKKGWGAQLWDFVLHIYHGFRLLLANVRVAMKLQKRVMKGSDLTRRERQLLERTTKDILRMVPFSFFILVPFAELLLPVALLIFPDLTPSTFTTRESLRKGEILRNLEKGVRGRRVFEHTFSRIIIEEDYDLYSSSWGILKRVGQGDVVTEKDIRYLAPHFQSGHKLDLRNVPSYILRDIARTLGIYHWLGGNFLPRTLYDARLRAAIEEHFDKFEDDDRSLVASGIDNLNEQELEHECMKRNMRWFASPRALRYQLSQWCSITQSDDIPTHILAFVRPCATSHREMLNYLSKEEIDHVLKLNKFEDAPMRNILVKLRQGVHSERTSTIDTSIMDEDLDKLKSRVDDLRIEEDAVEKALLHVKRALKDFDDPTLIKIYESCVGEEGEMRSCDSEIGVNVVVLCRFLMEKFKEKDPTQSLSTYRLILCLREFDIDDSDLITRSEFLSFVARIKADE